MKNTRTANERFLEELAKNRIIAILRGVPGDLLCPTAQVLYDGGLHMIEVALPNADDRPEAYADTLKGIKMIRDAFEDKLYLGAGTVLTPQQAEDAARNGAQYLIAPNFDPHMVACADSLGCAPLPGVLTPSEMVQAVQAGAPAVKLFPAGNMGTGYLRAILAPIPEMKIVAVGGITPDNLFEYLKAGAYGVGMGGALCDLSAIRAGKWEVLRNSAKALTATINEFISEK